MRHRDALTALLSGDPLRIEALAAIRSLALRDGWIGAGFVRDAVWDHLHGRKQGRPAGDVDVVWFDPARSDPDFDRDIERRLHASAPGFDWSVKNQARMHARNGDAPYRSVADAMRHWPETATAIAARLAADGRVEIEAPFGLDDLFALRLRPTPGFADAKRPIFDQRVAAKNWMALYPALRNVAG
jgi:hypothetical protein